MTYRIDDTIVAIASAAGGGPRGVIRLTGPAVAEVLTKCVAEDAWHYFESGHGPIVVQSELRLTRERECPVDVLWWPTIRSYTRQPSAEIHIIGSPPLLSLAVNSLTAAGARLAQPGEFTLRAFLAGRVDLTQAEAVLGVIDAQDQQQLDVSLAQMAGGIAQPLHELRSRLLNLLADLEAGLDFVEEDIRFISSSDVDRQLREGLETAGKVLEQLALRGLKGTVPQVALVGPPNAGKSSLFNALVQTTAAIVSDTPGTTRDYLSARLSIAGIVFDLIDTAGEETTTPLSIECKAQLARQQQANQAAVRLVCAEMGQHKHSVGTLASDEILVVTKCDQAGNNEFNGVICTSSVTCFGLDELRSAVTTRLAQIGGTESPVVQATAERCEESLRMASDALETARSLNAKGAGDELVAAEVRRTLDELGRVVGAVYTDDLLDRVFSRFCIGK
jgi:tRNA modification GTPase